MAPVLKEMGRVLKEIAPVLKEMAPVFEVGQRARRKGPRMPLPFRWGRRAGSPWVVRCGISPVVRCRLAADPATLDGPRSEKNLSRSERNGSRFERNCSRSERNGSCSERNGSRCVGVVVVVLLLQFFSFIKIKYALL